MNFLSILSSVGMAVGAPLVYADQAYSIYTKRDATGFSHDVCGVLLVANITRCFFWLGERFEIALLAQSLLMIVSQLGLLYLCLRFRATPPARQISAQPHSSGPGLIPQSPDEQRASREDLESSSSNQAKFNLVVSPPTPLDYREESNDVRRDSLNGSGDRLSLSPPSTARPQSAHSSSASRYKKPLLASLGLENLQIPVLGRTSRYGMIDEEEDGPASAQEPSTGPRSVYTRPFGLWQWQNFLSYLAFLVGYVTVLGLFNLILGRSSVYVAALGFLALGLESTLPIPQLLSNYRRKSLAGFRASVLVGWLAGDLFKTVYFILKSSPLQFTVCALFQLSIDFFIVYQSFLYLSNTKKEIEERIKHEEEQRASRGESEVVDVEFGLMEAQIEQDDEEEGADAADVGARLLRAGR